MKELIEKLETAKYEHWNIGERPDAGQQWAYESAMDCAIAIIKQHQPSGDEVERVARAIHTAPLSDNSIEEAKAAIAAMNMGDASNRKTEGLDENGAYAREPHPSLNSPAKLAKVREALRYAASHPMTPNDVAYEAQEALAMMDEPK